MDSIYIRVTINQFFVKLLRSTVSVTFFQLRFKQKGKTGIFSAALCNTRRWPKKTADCFVRNANQRSFNSFVRSRVGCVNIMLVQCTVITIIVLFLVSHVIFLFIPSV